MSSSTCPCCYLATLQGVRTHATFPDYHPDSFSPSADCASDGEWCGSVYEPESFAWRNWNGAQNQDALDLLEETNTGFLLAEYEEFVLRMVDILALPKQPPYEYATPMVRYLFNVQGELHIFEIWGESIEWTGPTGTISCIPCGEARPEALE